MWPFKKKEKKLTEFEEKILERCLGIKTWEFDISYIGEMQRLNHETTYYSEDLEFSIVCSYDSIYVTKDEVTIALSCDTFGVKFLELISEWERGQQAIREDFILSDNTQNIK